MYGESGQDSKETVSEVYGGIKCHLIIGIQEKAKRQKVIL